jgi:hypothetical protein
VKDTVRQIRESSDDDESIIIEISLKHVTFVDNSLGLSDTAMSDVSSFVQLCPKVESLSIMRNSLTDEHLHVFDDLFSHIGHLLLYHCVGMVFHQPAHE